MNDNKEIFLPDTTVKYGTLKRVLKEVYDLELKEMKKEDICPVGTEIQTLLFSKEKFTKKTAKSWADKYDFKYGKVDETENNFRLRQQEPSDFHKDTFRTIQIKDGLQAVIGCPKEKDGRKVRMAQGGEVDFQEMIDIQMRNPMSADTFKAKAKWVQENPEVFMGKFFSQGGNIELAKTIINQLGGSGKLTAMTGAYNFIAIPNGVSFRIKNQRANYIKITLTSMDLYDLEVGRIRGNNYTVVAKSEGLYNDMLKPAIEKATGMYLSLFAKGGGVGSEIAKMGTTVITKEYIDKRQMLSSAYNMSDINYYMFRGKLQRPIEEVERDIARAKEEIEVVNKRLPFTTWELKLKKGQNKFEFMGDVYEIYTEKRPMDTYGWKRRNWEKTYYGIRKITNNNEKDYFSSEPYTDKKENLVSGLNWKFVSLIYERGEIAFPLPENSSKMENGGGVGDVKFTSYEDAMSWIENESKKYKSKNEFYSTDIYKKTYPKIQKLYQEERKNFGKKGIDIMKSLGLDFGDKVFYDFVSPFGYVEEYTGIIIDKQGTPFVKLYEGQKTISGKTSVMWNKGWRKINTNEIGGEIMNEYSISNILSKTDFDEQTKKSMIEDFVNAGFKNVYALKTQENLSDEFKIEQTADNIMNSIDWNYSMSDANTIAEIIHSIKDEDKQPVKAKWNLTVTGETPEKDEGFWENYESVTLSETQPDSGRYMGYKWVEMSIKDGVPEGYWEKIVSEIPEVKEVPVKDVKEIEYSLQILEYLNKLLGRKLDKSFLIGKKVELKKMKGESQMPEGMTGIIDRIDDIGQFHIKWDNGSTLALIPEEDEFKVFFAGGEILVGGKGDKLTLQQIAKKHNVPLSMIQKQFLLGLKFESEHTSDKKMQEEIVKDHLTEFPNYYTALQGLETYLERMKDGTTASGLFIDIDKSVDIMSFLVPLSVQGIKYLEVPSEFPDKRRVEFYSDKDFDKAIMFYKKSLKKNQVLS